MEKKKRNLIACLISGIAIGMANLSVFYYKIKPTMSGMAISDFKEAFLKFDFSLIVFMIQWILVLLIIAVAYTKFLKHSHEDKIKVDYGSIKQRTKKGMTDIDLLYSLIKQKKNIKINTIAKVFKIDKDKALEWGKMLESQDLVTIEYPTFSDPEIEIKEIVQA